MPKTHTPDELKFRAFKVPLSFNHKRQLELIDLLQVQLARARDIVARSDGKPIDYVHAAITEIIISTNARLQFIPDDLEEIVGLVRAASGLGS